MKDTTKQTPQSERLECLQQLASKRNHADNLSKAHEEVSGRLLEQLAEMKRLVQLADDAREAWQAVQREIEQTEATLAREHGEGYLHAAIMRVQLAIARHKLAAEVLAAGLDCEEVTGEQTILSPHAAPLIEAESRAASGLMAAEQDLMQLTEAAIEATELRDRVDQLLKRISPFLVEEGAHHGN